MKYYNYYLCLQNPKNNKWHCKEYQSLEEIEKINKQYYNIYKNKVITTFNYNNIFLRDYSLLKKLYDIPIFDNFSFIKYK
jgi:hypothetical protein